MTTKTPQWTITKKDADGNPTRIETQLEGGAFYVCVNHKGWFFVCDALRMCQYIWKATTPEEAITESVVAIAQHLAQLSAELDAIRLTLS